MLLNLSIENYALIRHLDLRPDPHFTVLTGETGAGKSIIMGALGLVLGGRAEAKAVRQGATKCVVEASFDISRYDLEDYFRQNDLEYDPHATIIRREIYATGKSRAFVNDIPVQQQMLRDLGSHLLDIHSQHQNLLLGQNAFQLDAVDALARNAFEKGQYRAVYQELTKVRREIRALEEQAEREAREADYIRYQFAQLDDAALVAGEEVTLEAEQELLSHAEEIKSGLVHISDVLEGDYEEAIVSRLKTLTKEAAELAPLFPPLTPLSQRLQEDYIDLKDLSEEIASQADSVDFDPQRLAEIEERLSLLYSLEKKFGLDSVDALIEEHARLASRIEHLDSGTDALDTLRAQEKRLAAQAQKCAAALTATRKTAAATLSTQLVEKVSQLGMPNLRFEVQLTPIAEGLSPTGADHVEFLFSANKNQPLRPAGSVASGGEISRLMLGLKSLIATAKTLPTIVFDEIDTGISGDIADRMGATMQQLASHIQVLTITHLPQVASRGNTHLHVYKCDSDAADTETHIEALSPEQRLNEIARMLSGSDITPEAIANARALLSRT